MSARRLLLFSSRAGSGRTFLTANLGVALARATGRSGKVLLLEFKDQAQELALHLGLDAGPDLAQLRDHPKPWSLLPSAGHSNLFLASLDRGQSWDLPPALEDADWILLDGPHMESQGWDRWLDLCSLGLLVERGDLSGARRSLRALETLEAAHFPRQGLGFCYTPSDPCQPLPELAGLPALGLPYYPKAAERLAQAVLPAVSDPSSAFVKSLAQLAQCLRDMPERAQRKDKSLGTIAPTRIAAVQPADLQPNPLVEGYPRHPERTAILRSVLDGILEELDLKKLRVEDLSAPGFRQTWLPRVRSAAQSQLARVNADWMNREERAVMEQELCDQVLGLGPLEAPLADPQVSEIMVNCSDQVYLERSGKLSLSGIRFWDDRQLLTVIERIVAPLGRRIDESSPRVDARLSDGSRVNAIIPPLALKGPCLTVRKFPARRMTMDDLVAKGSLTQAAAAFLEHGVLWKKNVVVSGGTGSGKTTLLNVLSGFIPSGERVITVEDAAELKLAQEHVVSLEARPANLEGRGEVSIRDLVANCLRMRPDRIVVGECRGGEALDMLQAMNTGHEGSLTTVHANTPRDAVARLETLCLMSGVDLPLKVVRAQIAAAVDIIVQAARLKDGSRRITHVSEVLGMEGEVVVLQDIFLFRQTGMGPEGKVLGELKPTGVIPRCAQQAREAGEVVDLGPFQQGLAGL
jgi:pilus assembly protein CpaF